MWQSFSLSSMKCSSPLSLVTLDAGKDSKADRRFPAKGLVAWKTGLKSTVTSRQGPARSGATLQRRTLVLEEKDVERRQPEIIYVYYFSFSFSLPLALFSSRNVRNCGTASRRRVHCS
jgi:hypothetical protein